MKTSRPERIVIHAGSFTWPPALLAIFAAFALFCCPSAASAAGELNSLSEAIGFVVVDAVGSDDKPSQHTGSCIHILQGFCVTNGHVSPGNNATANTTQVVFRSGTDRELKCAAKVVAVHSDRDLALLKFELTEKLPTIPLGQLTGVTAGTPIQCLGFPLGASIERERDHPSVSISSGQVTAFRRDRSGRDVWFDVDASIAPGNSGGAIVSQEGLLLGVTTRGYKSFGRATPVEYVVELLGLALLDVSFGPETANGKQTQINVKSRHDEIRFKRGTVQFSTGAKRRLRQQPKGHALSAQLPLAQLRSPENLKQPVIVDVITHEGFRLLRMLHNPCAPKNDIKLRGTVHWIRVQKFKPNGFHWDNPLDGPDLYYQIHVNRVLVATAKVRRNQFRTLQVTEFDCKTGDAISIVVFDKDVARDDEGGSIQFQAAGDLTVKTPTTGVIQSCLVTVREVPARLPVKPKN